MSAHAQSITDAAKETVAKAIYRVSCIEADDGVRPISNWAQLLPETRDVYLKMARAAMDAVFEMQD